ncbi:MAG: hypothetical protein QOF92_1870 [Pseudonocardiales bacterium]|nr:hypothetical protein [Pseudonocardiales bacterium]
MATAATNSSDPPKSVEEERLLLVRCVEIAFESLRLMPGVDTSGRTLVWFAGHILQAYRNDAKGG